MAEDGTSVQLIDGHGDFNSSGLEQRVKTARLEDRRPRYAVVSIMGRQSSGKSTLLNHLFQTCFAEMDVTEGWSKTTEGIWMDVCSDEDPTIVALDLEGTDGRERGKDTIFERQSALFALAVSDVVLLNMYDEAAKYYDDGAKSSERELLEKTILQLIYPAYKAILGHLEKKTLEDFKRAFHNALISGKKGFAAASRDFTQLFLSEFDIGSADAAIKPGYWGSSEAAITDAGLEDSSEHRKKLVSELEKHVKSILLGKLDDFMKKYKEQLKEELEGPVAKSLDTGDDGTWPSIRELLHRVAENAKTRLSSDLDELDIDQETEKKIIADLTQYATDVVDSKSRSETRTEMVLMLMTERFNRVFQGQLSADISNTAAAEEARRAALKLLAVRAAIRLEDTSDDIESILSQALMVTPKPTASDPLAFNRWTMVCTQKTLLKPAECKALWERFLYRTGDTIDEANHRKGNVYVQSTSDAAAPAPGGIRDVAVRAGSAMMEEVATLTGSAIVEELAPRAGSAIWDFAARMWNKMWGSSGSTKAAGSPSMAREGSPRTLRPTNAASTSPMDTIQNSASKTMRHIRTLDYAQEAKGCDQISSAAQALKSINFASATQSISFQEGMDPKAMAAALLNMKMQFPSSGGAD